MKWKNILTSACFVENVKMIENAEVDRIFCTHDMVHLFDTARVMYIISLEKRLEISKDVIYATALFHDIGRAVQYITGEPHAIAGLEIARRILSDANYEKDEMDIILAAIENHACKNLNKSVQTLTDLLAYADKEVRTCWCCKASTECYWSIERKKRIINY